MSEFTNICSAHSSGIPDIGLQQMVAMIIISFAVVFVLVVWLRTESKSCNECVNFKRRGKIE